MDLRTVHRATVGEIGRSRAVPPNGAMFAAPHCQPLTGVEFSISL
jgi:hypothetical protein